MEKYPTLIPNPRQIIFIGDIYNVASGKILQLTSDQPQRLLLPALGIKNDLRNAFALEYEINASTAVLRENIGITLRIVSDPKIPSQGYQLSITSEGITLEAGDERGIFYGCCTLRQILHYYFRYAEDNELFPAGCIPCMHIIDWPDYQNRGVMLDISRDKVPTMETLFNLVDLLSSWKINQLQLYTEHTFAYQRHPEVWAEYSPISGEEILILDQYCRERFIELVPNQNSFGHLEHWLKHPRYNDLAEAPDGFEFPWGHHPKPFSLNPLDPRSIEFISGLYDELLLHFSSRQVNVGCDETFDLGQGRSKDTCEKIGRGRVYLDFLFKIYNNVTKRGFKMQFWGDIIMAHPELVTELPKDAIALAWGYEARHPFDEHGEKFAQSGISFYVCPGTSSWNSIAGRTENCIQNIANAAENGRKHGATGYLITDWGDNGHWQALPVSYLGFAAGAAYSWSLAATSAMDVKKALSYYAFRDNSNTLGTIAFDLGNVYQEVGIAPENSSALFHILQKPISEWREYIKPDTALEVFTRSLEAIDRSARDLDRAQSTRGDKALLAREFTQTIHFLRHACWRGLFGVGSKTHSKEKLLKDLRRIIPEYREIWLLRNRPGGLQDSLAYFDVPMKDYQT